MGFKQNARCARLQTQESDPLEEKGNDAVGAYARAIELARKHEIFCPLCGTLHDFHHQRCRLCGSKVDWDKVVRESEARMPQPLSKEVIVSAYPMPSVYPVAFSSKGHPRARKSSKKLKPVDIPSDPTRAQKIESLFKLIQDEQRKEVEREAFVEGILDEGERKRQEKIDSLMRGESKDKIYVAMRSVGLLRPLDRVSIMKNIKRDFAVGRMGANRKRRVRRKKK